MGNLLGGIAGGILGAQVGKGNGQVVAAAGTTMGRSLADNTAAYDNLYP